MSDIAISSTQFFRWDTTTSPNSFSQQTNLSFSPDVAIIRQITFIDSDPTTDSGCYFIHSNLSNNFIGSFMISGDTTNDISTHFISNPQTVLTGVHNTPSSLTFQIQMLNGSSLTSPINTLTGVVSLQIDFIKYIEK
jgi:hypothetical protein